MWLGIIISLIVAAIFMGLISYVESCNFVQPRHRRTKWFSHFWFLFRVAINRIKILLINSVVKFFKIYIFKASEEIHFSLPTRLVVAVWCLIAVVFVNSYTSSLVSYLTAPRFIPLINTVQDLADSREIKIAPLKFTSIDSALAVSIFCSTIESKRDA